MTPPAERAPASPSLNERAQRVVARLEAAVQRCAEHHRHIEREAAGLRDQVKQLKAERAQLREKNDEARHRVESMIARLRSMGEPT